MEKICGRPDHLRMVAETVCEYFAYKLDGHGRPRDIAVEEYANRLVQLYEGLTGRPITYAKATDTSRERWARLPRRRGFKFELAQFVIIKKAWTPARRSANQWIRAARQA